MAQKLSTLVAAEPATDLAVVQEMARQLADYIQGGEVYRTLALHTAHGEERVQTSGGDLLARLHKLMAQKDQLSPEEKRTLEEVLALIQDTKERLDRQFQALLVREAKARLNSLKWFLDDCQGSRQECRVQYPFEIRNRQRIAEIVKALDESAQAELADQLASIDQHLRSLISGNAFVWDQSVAQVYPRTEYWYLYGLPAG